MRIKKHPSLVTIENWTQVEGNFIDHRDLQNDIKIAMSTTCELPSVTWCNAKVPIII
jgi:hypothetical protein